MIIVQSKVAAVVPTQEFQNSAASEVLIDKCRATNTDTTTRTLSVWIVPPGGTADSTNLALTVDIDPSKSYLCGEIVGDILGPNDSIWFQGSATTLAIRCTGRLRV